MPTLTFTAADWSTAQTITLNAADDQIDDEDASYTIVTTVTSSDAKYSGLDATDVSVTVIDNDEAGVTVTPTSDPTTSEAGAHATFTVVLDSQPTANVTIGLTSSDPGEGPLSRRASLSLPTIGKRRRQ